MSKAKNREKNLEKQIVKILRESYLEMQEIENFDAESFPFYLLRTAMIELIQWHDPDYVQSIIENTWLQIAVEQSNDLTYSSIKSKTLDS